MARRRDTHAAAHRIDLTYSVNKFAFSHSNWSADQFLESYEIYSMRNASRRQKRRQQQRERAKRQYDQAPRDDIASVCIERARDTSRLVEARYHSGFRWPGGTVGSYVIPAQEYHGLVSDEHPILKLFVTKTHRAAKLRSGNSKAEIMEGGPKVLALDEAYVETNREMRGVLRVEIDRDFPSFEFLEHELRRIGCPLPNVIVGNLHYRTGALQHPHLLWIIEDSVNFMPSGRPRFMALFRHVLRGLTHVCQQIGADAGGLNNSLRVKNPLSPLWSRHVAADAPWSLERLSKHLPRAVSDQDLFGMKARAEREMNEIISRPGSNSFFGAVRQFAYSHVAHHHELNSQVEFTGAVGVFAAELADVCDVRQRQAAKVAERVATWTWQHHDPNRASCRQSGQGPCETSGLSTAAAQAVGGQHSAQQRLEKTLLIMVAAYREIAATGVTPTQSAIAQHSGLGIATVKRNWKAMLALIDSNPEPPQPPRGIIQSYVKKSQPIEASENIPYSEIKLEMYPPTPRTGPCAPPTGGVRPGEPKRKMDLPAPRLRGCGRSDSDDAAGRGYIVADVTPSCALLS